MPLVLLDQTVFNIKAPEPLMLLDYIVFISDVFS